MTIGGEAVLRRCRRIEGTAGRSASNRPVRSIGRATKMLRDNTKVLFRRGDMFDLSDRIELKHNNILFGAYSDLSLEQGRSEAAATTQTASINQAPSAPTTDNIYPPLVSAGRQRTPCWTNTA